jgi:tryptophan halogenase
VNYQLGVFHEPSWVAVYLGQRVTPARYDPLADRVPLDEARREAAEMRAAIRQAAESMPTHAEFIASYCATG